MIRKNPGIVFYSGVLLFSIFYYAVDDKGDVGCEQFYRDGEQNNAEEFSKHVNAAGTEEFFNVFSEAQNAEDDQHVGADGTQNVYAVVLRPDGQHSSQSTGTGDQRENNREKAAVTRAVRCGFEDFDVKYHFKSHDENNQRAGNRERGYVYAEQGQEGFSDIEKDEKHGKGKQCRFSGMDDFSLTAER